MPEPLRWIPRKYGTQAPVHLLIPQPDGNTALIPTVKVTKSSKELKIFFNPTGDGLHHQAQMRKKGLI